MTKPRLFINGYGVVDVAYDPVDSVSVTADGVKTYDTLLNELLALIDVSRLTRNSGIYIEDNGKVFHSNVIHSTFSEFVNANYTTSSPYLHEARIRFTYGSGAQYRNFTTSGYSDQGTGVPTSGTKITFYY